MSDKPLRKRAERLCFCFSGLNTAVPKERVREGPHQCGSLISLSPELFVAI
jgi:hypothetical protein